MKPLPIVIITLAVIALLSFGLVLTGWYNIAATDHHTALTHWVLDLALERSVDHHAAGLQAPASWQDSTSLRTGASHYDQMCKGCHGAPGINQGYIAASMYPTPPELALVAGTALLDREEWHQNVRHARIWQYAR